jgi:hypothetical protein
MIRARRKATPRDSTPEAVAQTSRAPTVNAVDSGGLGRVEVGEVGW